MASRSVSATPTPSAPLMGEWVHSASINMQDMLLDIAISNGAVGREAMVAYSKMMARWAKSILVVARARGDNESDAPGTFEDALAGAEFFLHLSGELEEAAPKMQEGE